MLYRKMNCYASFVSPSTLLLLFFYFHLYLLTPILPALPSPPCFSPSKHSLPHYLSLHPFPFQQTFSLFFTFSSPLISHLTSPYLFTLQPIIPFPFYFSLSTPFTWTLNLLPLPSPSHLISSAKKGKGTDGKGKGQVWAGESVDLNSAQDKMMMMGEKMKTEFSLKKN